MASPLDNSRALEAHLDRKNPQLEPQVSRDYQEIIENPQLD